MIISPEHSLQVTVEGLLMPSKAKIAPIMRGQVQGSIEPLLFQFLGRVFPYVRKSFKKHSPKLNVMLGVTKLNSHEVLFTKTHIPALGDIERIWEESPMTAFEMIAIKGDDFRLAQRKMLDYFAPKKSSLSNVPEEDLLYLFEKDRAAPRYLSLDPYFDRPFSDKIPNQPAVQVSYKM